MEAVVSAYEGLRLFRSAHQDDELYLSVKRFDLHMLSDNDRQKQFPSPSAHQVSHSSRNADVSAREAWPSSHRVSCSNKSRSDFSTERLQDG